MKWLTILPVLVVLVLKIHKVKSREFGIYKELHENGVRGNIEIRRRLFSGRRMSFSARKIHTDVPKHKSLESVIYGHKYTKNDKPKHWGKTKQSLTRYPFRNPVFEFVDLPRNEQIAALNSYAVREPVKATNHGLILSIAAAVMLIVVLVVCLHAPCTCLMRKRHKNDLEVDLIGCPNPTVRKGRCGKCIFDRASKNYASRYRITKSTYSSASSTKEELFLSPDYQPPWITDSNKPSSDLPNPKKSKSIVKAILKRSRDRDKFRYEFLASRYGYDNMQFRDSGKRSSIYDEQDPSWYSAGEFLNNQSNSRGQKTYGSTDFNKINSSYCQWSRDSHGSRDSGKSTNQSVEDIIKLQPRRRQVLELQEFPLGYSQSYAGVDVNGKENELFDPIQDTRHMCRHESSGQPISAMSESNLDMYFLQMDKKSQTNKTAEDGVKTGKRREKPRPTSPKPGAKIVQFYPTSFDYNTKFVQNGRKSKSTGKVWLGERSDSDDKVSSDELSFDEEDEFQIKQDFLYSPHMQGYPPCHHYHHYYSDYPAILRYPDIPRHNTRPPKEYKTRMRREVARSESELRRTSGIFGHQGHASRQGYSRRGNHVSSSDTSLDRMQIENELAAVGLVKPKKKLAANNKMTVRDNRLEPLAGIMSPMRPLDNPAKKSRACDNTGQGEHHDEHLVMQNAMVKKKFSEDKSYVVNLPSLEPSGKEGVDSKVSQEPRQDMNVSIKGTKREQYSRNPIALDPHYIKNSYLQEEPVRDTDSDDAGENIASYLPSHCRANTGNGGKTREEDFSAPRSTTL